MKKNAQVLLALCLFTQVEVGIAADVQYSVYDSTHLIRRRKADSHLCKVDRAIDSAVLSFDESAIIVSDRGFVKTSDLVACREDTVAHVWQIPDRVGVLADINVDKNIYVAVDFVSVAPFSYLATVAHFGSRKNLVTMHGAYISGMRLSELQKHAFSSSGDAGSAAIAPDGRYVAPASTIDCSAGASPGVWDIKSNKKVIADEVSCAALFRTSVKNGKNNQLEN